jgi:hypothetical protein
LLGEYLDAEYWFKSVSASLLFFGGADVLEKKFNLNNDTLPTNNKATRESGFGGDSSR